MDTSHDPSTHDVVTVGVDGSVGGDRALAWAAREASLRGVPLRLLYALHPLGTNERAWLATAGVVPDEVREAARNDAEHLLKAATERALDVAADLTVQTEVLEADARQALMASDSTLLVVGSRGRGPLRSLLLGSVGVGLIRHASVPVAVVRDHDAAQHGGVVVGTGGTEASRPALVVAFEEAALRGTPLTVVHCLWASVAGYPSWVDLPVDSLESEEAWVAVESLIGDLRERHPDVVVRRRLTRGLAERCLVDLAAEAELVVVGRHGVSPLDYAGLGNVSTAVVEHARSVVMVVPADFE